MSRTPDDASCSSVPPTSNTLASWLPFATPFWGQGQGENEDDVKGSTRAPPVRPSSPRAQHAPHSPRAMAASQIVEASARSAISAIAGMQQEPQSQSGTPHKLVPTIGEIPPPPTLILPPRPPPLELKRLQSPPTISIGDDSSMAPNQQMIRNLDTGEVISYQQADDKLHGSLTTLTSGSSGDLISPGRQSPRRWAWSMLTPRFTKSNADIANANHPSTSPRPRLTATPRAPSAPQQRSAASKATSIASDLAQRATKCDHDGLEYEAISLYRQAVRMLLVALDLSSQAEQGQLSGIDPHTLHYYAKLYKARATKLEDALESQLPRDVLRDPHRWFKTQSSSIQAELDTLDALDAEDARLANEARLAQEMALEDEALAAQEAALDAELIKVEEAALLAQQAALEAEEIELAQLEEHQALARQVRDRQVVGAAASVVRSRQLVPALAIPHWPSNVEDDAAFEGSSPTCATAQLAAGSAPLVRTISKPALVPTLAIPAAGPAAAGCASSRFAASSALASARTARNTGAMTARSGLKPELESVGMLTPRSGKDTDERLERRQCSCESAREAPPSSRRVTAPRSKQPATEQIAALPSPRLGADSDDEGSSAAQLAAGSAPLVRTISKPALVPTLAIPAAGPAAAGCASSRFAASSALASARTARNTGAMTARSGLKPELESVGMLTPRSGKDTDERLERRQCSCESAREAPPSSRRVTAPRANV